MPVTFTSDYSMGVAKSLSDVFVDAEERIFATMARRLAKGLDTDRMDKMLMDVQSARRELEKVVATLDSTSSATMKQLVWQSFNRGVALAGNDLRIAGTPAAVSFSAVNTRALVALVDTETKMIGSTMAHIQSNAEAVYKDVIRQAAARSLVGTETRREASAWALRQWEEQGIPAFRDSRGRQWDMASYAEMSGRTASAQSMMAGHVERLTESGHSLVMISDAPEECETCRPYEGKILSLTTGVATGMHTAPNGARYEVAGSLAAARGNGLFHPNCRHRTVVYLPGYTKPLVDTADPEGNALRVKQREYERRIRKAKLKSLSDETILGKSHPQTMRSKKKVNELNREFSAWRSEHGRKNLAYRTQVGGRKFPEAPKVDIPTPSPTPVKPPTITPEPILPDKPLLSKIPSAPDRQQMPYEYKPRRLNESVALIQGRIDELLTNDNRRQAFQMAVDNARSVADPTRTQLFVATPPNIINAILEQGRWKSAFEVPSRAGGAGRDYVKSRRDYENDRAGVPQKTKPAERPIYGYVRDEPDEFISQTYGQVHAVLNPSVRGRTTMTFGDSLNDRGFPLPIDDVAHADPARLIAAAKPDGMGGVERPIRYYDEQKTTQGQVTPSVEEGTKELITGGRYNYSEIQIHGGLRVEDVREWVIDLRGGLPESSIDQYRKVGEALSEKGYKVKYLEPPVAQRTFQTVFDELMEAVDREDEEAIKRLRAEMATIRGS